MTNKCTIEAPSNKSGVITFHGKAVEQGGINDQNVGRIMKKLDPLLALARRLILRKLPPEIEYVPEKKA